MFNLPLSSLFRRFLILLIALLLVSSGSAFAAEKIDGDYANGRVLVKFKTDLSKAEVARFAAAHNLKLRSVIRHIAVHGFDFADGRSVPSMVEALSKDPRVAFAEPDYIRYACLTPNDPLYGSQWDMVQINVNLYWDFLIGTPSVVTAIIDTGIDLTHPDLVNQLWQNPGEIPGNNVDDDGNGYKDDYNGYDFAGNGVFPLPGAEDPIPNDDYVGHGTHVAGTVAAQQNNSIGITGEAPGTKVMAVRVLGGAAGSGYSSDIADGIIYAADNGAKVINLSLGGTGAGLTEYLALQHAWDNNVFVAAASGNDGDSGNPISYPAGFLFTMSVGATDSADGIAYFSTHNTFVEVSAPGVNILSTIPVGTYEGGWSGTSMATPHVAGLAALLYSTYGDMTNWQARSMLQHAVVDRGTAGWDQYFGYGRVTAGQLLVTPRPTGATLEILTPPNGGVFPRGSILSLLWNPVNGAVNYRLTASLPTGGTVVLTTTDPYYTRPPSSPAPSGSYSVTVEALGPTGATLSSDVVTFIKQ